MGMYSSASQERKQNKNSLVRHSKEVSKCLEGHPHQKDYLSECSLPYDFLQQVKDKARTDHFPEKKQCPDILNSFHLWIQKHESHLGTFKATASVWEKEELFHLNYMNESALSYKQPSINCISPYLEVVWC